MHKGFQLWEQKIWSLYSVHNEKNKTKFIHKHVTSSNYTNETWRKLSWKGDCMSFSKQT